ncbi:folylpolyglutamate synthase/dihydrofolate synthase family protein [soil metagenome]
MKTSYRSIDDVYARLDNIPMFGQKGRAAANFSLDSIRLFADKMGNPHLNVPSIHAAGTNGKGTTCRILSSIYQSAGYKTGVFTSPHLIDFRERFMINAEMISEQELLKFFRIHEELIDEIPLTYFELSTAIAFWYFSDQNTDIAIYETGLGGRLDATNILQPLVSVITSVGLDHMDILGSTIEEIAKEKAGIIKPDTQVVTGHLSQKAFKIVKRIAKQQGSTCVNAISGAVTQLLKTADPAGSWNEVLSEKYNKPIAIAVTNCLSERYPVSLENLRIGLELWRERYPTGVSFQQLHPELQWYFDGAHNVEAIKLLMCQLREIAPLSDWTFVLAMMGDKLNEDIGKQVSETGIVFYYSIKSERAASEKQMKFILADASKFPLRDDNMPADDWIQKYKSELVIFGGSFYFYQTVKQWMGNIAT